LQALRDGEPDLGDVPWREIPGYLALADAYVQPGGPNDFNRYRLPSKLPEFLAMGRPVILPACNLAEEMNEGENALLLHRGDALEIAAGLERLLDEPGLAERLGTGARQFAVERLSWPRNAAALADFYRRRLVSAAVPAAA
jgi:glycosyltransferase involved in cell wall biosynthesis